MYVYGRKVVLLLSLLWVVPCFATIKVSVDRQPVHLDESFQLFFESDSALDNPDFTPLQQDFDILSTAQSSSTSIINGTVKSLKKWTLQVIARRQGALPIPAITFTNQQSPAGILNVKPSNQPADTGTEADIFLQAEVVPEQVYVQQQILFTLRLFLAVPVSNANLAEPTLSGVDAVIQKMGDDKKYDTQRDGRRYTVYQRHYAIFPQASGNLTIEPIIFQAQAGGGSVLNLLNRSAKQIAKRTQAITLNVRSPVANYQGGAWLPAEAITLQENWLGTKHTGTPVFYVDQPITRTVTLQAKGLIASQLPQLDMAIDDNFKQYPDQALLEDQVSEHGINGKRVEKVALIPKMVGEYRLPEIVVPWWDIESNQQQYARLPERLITVLPSLSAANITTADASQQQAVVAEQQSVGQAITTADAIISTNDIASNRWWQGSTIFFALAWLLTLCAYLRVYFRQARFTRQALQVKQQAEGSLRATVALLKRSCKAHDAQAVKDALLRWHNHYHADQPSTNLGELGKYYDASLASEMDTLNQSLYSDVRQAWNGDGLWQSIDSWQQQQASKVNDKVQLSSLQPLYRS